MIFGEEVELDDENIKFDYHRYTVGMIGRVLKTEPQNWILFVCV